MRRTEFKQNQRGFASIVVGLIMVVVMALLTVGFAQLTRREQQDVLNKELATQAYYAAESGINDTIAEIGNTIKPGESGTNAPNSNQCLSSTYLPSSLISSNDAVSYPCVIVNTSTPNITYSDIAKDTAETVLTNSSPALDSVTVTWKSFDPSHTNSAPAPSTVGDFVPQSSWPADTLGVIQFSLTPFNQTSFSRQSLINQSFTTYLYPSAGANVVPYTTASAPASTNGTVVPGGCSAGICSATITGIPASSAYLMHFLDFYDDSSVAITGKSGGSAVTFSGGQVEIDATGQAKDVLKRIQVRADVDNNPNLPNYALEGQAICKREEVAPATANNPTGTAFDPLSNACNPEDQ